MNRYIDSTRKPDILSVDTLHLPFIIRICSSLDVTASIKMI